MDEQKDQQKNAAPAENKGSNKDMEENKLWAFLGYLWILCLIPLLAKKDSPFAQFHAKQGLVMLIGWFFVWIPFVGWLLGLALFIFWIIAVVNVFSGKMTPLPIIGDLAAKIKI